MKVLYITLENLSFHKGSVVHIKEIVSGLRKLGHRVGLIACSWNNFEEADSFYNLHKFLGIKRQPYIISSVLLFIYLLKMLPKYDVIYARDYHTVIIAFLPRIIFEKKLIFEINGLASEEQKLKKDSVFNRVLSFLIRRAEKVATKYSDRIVSVTPQIATYLVRQFYCPADKVEVIGNGVNTKIFRPMLDKDSLSSWKEKLGITKEEAVIAFIGNLAPWQGVNIFIESAFRLLSIGEKLKFLIVGDGLLKDSLIKRVLYSGYRKDFIFTGMITYEKIPILINIADICVAPFISQRNRKTGVSPLKVFEYMACGKPVTASRVDGLEFIEAEGAGKLVEPGDIKDLERALVELLKDSQKRAEMGHKGLQIVKERFSWDIAAIKVEKIFKRLA